ncbi:AT-rich interactive domain-containing protein 4 [Camellia sinensis]|uniref:AT-rich interactive domain-containing protein 4 n=1 Tax=Camellia sinensis TaxID=4442 RepID=UPI0010362A30|nr:AT-rich interactive domain-containing protein 4 [Camellia sinensis]XP_028064255.1 AT-rich interactive domain-containing protein 4 [Camellia sinensis]XP_028064256.1 AT-rich interactive domain-containing protein 4 [Camellia sinensis]XP_028064257.1 AT-rich interactive domain-containing protein 4 [Camellia sinensis]XP_028064258.1 AT-rich interactive domain-containing protein 4 [Camellia sinensis]XP_028064259.1 AT-rich interactive domain-containing protein 4 [Camellia sinensis]XP_028064260.1 AT
MMFHVQGASKHTCGLLAVLSGRSSEYKHKQGADDGLRYPFPEIVSSGRLEVQTLNSPSIDEFHKILDSSQPNFVYLQGEQLPNDEVGSLVWGGIDVSTAEAVAGLFGSTLPTTVYLEIPNGEKLAEALQSKGIPYVIYWKNAFSRYAACHFRHALFSVVQSSSSHTWDAFQLAHASLRLYCVRNNLVLPGNSQRSNDKLVPYLLGDPPMINVTLPEIAPADDDESSLDGLPAIKIYDDDVNMKFLVCGVACTLDACLLGSLEDGLNALLSIEIRGSKLHNRVSALPPPLQAGTFSRGVVTMRCDLSTCSSAHISLLVSGSAQTCFDDLLLENHIKSEVIEKSQLVHALPNCEENKPPLSEPRRSASIACGAAVFEVCMKVPSWASQVLRQLAPDVSYRSLVGLGIASIQGLAVASFEKDDAERFLFFCTRPGEDLSLSNSYFGNHPSWLRPPIPSRKRYEMCRETSLGFHNGLVSRNQASVKREDREDKDMGLTNGVNVPFVPVRQKLKVAAMRPIPHIRHQKMLPFSATVEGDGHEGGQVKANLSVAPLSKHSVAGSNPVTHRKSYSNSFQAKQIISLNPLPLKKHGCDRSPIHVCSEEEFLKDVMQFLILRGHTRLIPQGGLSEFPDAILNAKRLDLFNLYREVVSRGGFHVGNGINWKGQVFSKMRNHTVTNRMTGVGNTLKRHYETYLLEYELAHDDVDGECCLLCHSSAAGDWVNCGICGEWAHFGCDRRQGLGAFKDYAKTDGLEYICPQCSISNFKKKLQKTTNGYS